MSTASTPELHPAAGTLLPRPFRIRKRSKELATTFTWELEPADGGPPLAFAPGQFNMVYLFGSGEVPISISGDPARPERLIHTIRAVGAVTTGMQQLKRGATVGLRGPFGTAWPLAEARGQDVIVIVGGLGLAPLRPALYSILAERERYNRVTLLYGTRGPEDILYRKELEQWRGRLDMDVHITIDRPSIAWRGPVGVVTTLLPRATYEAGQTIALVCGPEVMMRFAAQELEQRGLNAQQIYLSMERNMKCAVAFCGHCQFGPSFVCKDGPVFRYDTIRDLLARREI